CFLPALANLDRKSTASRAVLVAPAIAGIAIDGERAGLNKSRGRPAAFGDGCAENADRIDAGRDDFALVRRRVSAIHAFASQVYDCRSAIKKVSPLARSSAVPLNMMNRSFLVRRCSPQDNDVISLREEQRCDRPAEETAASRENDALRVGLHFSSERSPATEKPCPPASPV